MRIKLNDAVLMVIDFQERLAPSINQIEATVKKAVTLIEGAKTLGVPTLITEQYKRGIGETVPEVKDATTDNDYLEKVTFSCMDDDAICDWVKKQDRKQIILCGIEAHICVLQTLIDLKELGYEVYLVCDAVSSRTEFDCKTGLKRAMQEGAYLTTVEAVLFELTRSSKHECFKTISKLIK